MYDAAKPAILVQKNRALVEKAVGSLKGEIGKLWASLLETSGKEALTITPDSDIYKMFMSLPQAMKISTMSHFSEWLCSNASKIIPTLQVGEGADAVYCYFRVATERVNDIVHITIVDCESGLTYRETYHFENLIGMLAHGFDFHGENPLFFTNN